MRPVDKGKAPETIYKKYQDAEPDLEERIGAYCSFCELPIKHVPEVEHKEAKAKGGDELKWDNLLLSCKYCNTRKGTKVGLGDKGKYLWPDEDDTFHPFLYDRDIPRLNEDYLKGQSKEVQQKAVNIFNLVKLDIIPISPQVKDKRYFARSEARNCAVRSKEGWETVKQTSARESYLEQIKMLAKNTGFFSTWMSVFQDDVEVKEMLVNSFKGTKKEYCLEKNT